MTDNKITITFPDGKVIETPYRTRISDLTDNFNMDREKIFAVKVNNKVYSMEKHLKYSAEVEPVLYDSKEGIAVYRRSLCLLLAAAAYHIYPDRRLLVGHSLGSGYYYTLDTEKPICEKDIKALEQEMNALVKKNLPIESHFVSYNEAVELIEKSGLTETRRQMNFLCPPRVRINSIGDFSDLHFGPLVPHTGMLKHFELRKYGEGFLLRFPKSSDQSKIPEFVDQPKLFEIYRKYKTWGKRLGVTSVASLNELIVSRKINDFIDITETLQEKCISEIASQIAEKQTARVILIAGPSSSGKTTTSKKLALELQALGYIPKVISLDCYYVDHSRTPVDENGEPDYECLEALDIELLNKNLVDLFAEKEVIIPTYNFADGTQSFKEKNKMVLKEHEILIMEGIHGLNDKLTPKVPAEYKFKIYLSALTQLNLDDHNRIPTSDNRLIRRIVRDSQFRGKPAAGTIAMWPSVRRGEEKYIFPFQNNADAILNTALDYELSVLKIYAEPLLRCVKPSEPEYSEACRLLHFLEQFASIAPTAVPPRSIIREFIGGSAFKY
ncbi:MAG: nucleoside kinase [Treponema sp.]|nr:nucleoside kinase [Treponema sp.]